MSTPLDDALHVYASLRIWHDAYMRHVIAYTPYVLHVLHSHSHTVSHLRVEREDVVCGTHHTSQAHILSYHGSVTLSQSHLWVEREDVVSGTQPHFRGVEDAAVGVDLEEIRGACMRASISIDLALT